MAPFSTVSLFISVLMLDYIHRPVHYSTDKVGAVKRRDYKSVNEVNLICCICSSAEIRTEMSQHGVPIAISAKFSFTFFSKSTCDFFSFSKTGDDDDEDTDDDTSDGDEGLLGRHSSQQQQQQSTKLCPNDRHKLRIKMGVAEALTNIRN